MYINSEGLAAMPTNTVPIQAYLQKIERRQSNQSRNLFSITINKIFNARYNFSISIL